VPFALPYQVSDWPAPMPFPATDTLSITIGQFAGAAVMVGRWPGDLGVHGRFSVADAAHRATCIRAYFQVREGRLTHSPVYKQLDPTEKAIAAYYMGMAAAKIFADRRLGVPWLAHLSRYGPHWSVVYSGTKRPDLFGPTPTWQWVIAEAKGRVRTRQSLIDTMKHQKAAVASVNGNPPLMRVGTTTRFPGRNLELRVVDPPLERRGLHFQINPARWVRRYYAPVVELISRRASNGQDDYAYGRLDDADLELGRYTLQFSVG
jgi:hypothetical protein